MTMARAKGTPASAIRPQKPAISSLSVRPISPASVTQPANSSKDVWFISNLRAARTPVGERYSSDGQPAPIVQGRAIVAPHSNGHSFGSESR